MIPGRLLPLECRIAGRCLGESTGRLCLDEIPGATPGRGTDGDIRTQQ